MKKLLLALIAVISTAIPGFAANKLIFFEKSNDGGWNNPYIHTWEGGSDEDYQMKSFWGNLYVIKVTNDKFKVHQNSGWNDGQSGEKNISNYTSPKCLYQWDDSFDKVATAKLNSNIADNSWSEIDLNYDSQTGNFVSDEITAVNNNCQYQLILNFGTQTYRHKSGTTLTVGSTVQADQESSNNVNGSATLTSGKKYVFTYDATTKDFSVREVQGSEPADTYATVYLNAEGWTKAYAYAWDANDSNKEYLGAYPGTEMTSTGNGTWKIDVNTKATNIKFSNEDDTKDSGDQGFEAGKTYTVVNETQTPTYKYYIYFKNTNNWEKPCAWVYDKSGASCNANSSWPGDNMTLQDDGLYFWGSNTDKTPDKVIFSNNKDDQKGDFGFENGATYDVNGKVTEGGDTPDNPNISYDTDWVIYADMTNVNWTEPYLFYALNSENGINASRKVKGIKVPNYENLYVFCFNEEDNNNKIKGMRFCSSSTLQNNDGSHGNGDYWTGNTNEWGMVNKHVYVLKSTNGATHTEFTNSYVPPTPPTSYYLNLNGSSLTMTKSGSNYVYTAKDITLIGNGAKFYIEKTVGTTTTTLGNGTANATDVEVFPATLTTTEGTSGAWNIAFDNNSALTFTFTPSSNTLRVTAKPATVYLSARGWKSPYAYLYSSTGNIAANPKAVMTAQSNNMYVLTGIDAMYDRIIFADSNGNRLAAQELIDGRCYNVNGTYDDNYDPTPYVYFNAFADFFRTDVFYSKAPWVSFRNSSTKSWTPGIQMELVDGEETMFRAPIQNPENYDAVKFADNESFNNPANHNYNVSFSTGNSQNYTPDDKENWYEYIYCFGGSKANQSYLTFAEYQQLRDNRKTMIYFVGRNVGNGLWNMASPQEAEKSEDVYIMEVDLSTNSFARFKMSYINPNNFTNENFEGVAKTSDLGNRWWATFNLGILGPADTNASGTENDADDEDNNYIQYEMLRAEEYNHYNQFDWRVEKDEQTTKYFVVVDPDYGTSALISFDPTAEISGEVSDIETIPNYVIKDGTKGWRGNGTEIRGASESGHVQMPYINKASGSVTVSATEYGTIASNDYTVAYDIFFQEDEDAEEILLGRYQGVPETISMDYLIAGQSAKVYGRATFTDLKGTYVADHRDSEGNIMAKKGDNLKFRSRTASGAISSEDEFEVPQIEEDYKLLWIDGEVGDQAQWSATLRVHYSMPQKWDHPMHGFDPENISDRLTSLAWYPAFRAVADNGARGRIAEATNFTVVKDPKFYLGEKKGHTPAKTLEGYDHNEHNWSYLADTYHDAATEGYYHIYVPAVEIAARDASVNTKVTFNGYAAYPFLTNPNQSLTVTGSGEEQQSAPRRFSVRKAGELENTIEPTDPSLNITVVHVPANVINSNGSTNLTVDYNSDGNLSGITDAMINGSDAEAEYFNLQGIRVEGELVPGIYLMRRGNRVEKVVVK